MTTATRGLAAVRRRPAAACRHSSGLGSRVTGGWLRFLVISIFVLPRRKEGMPLCVVCRPLKFGRGPEWAVGGSALPWSERKLLPVTGCCLMTTKLESFVSFLCKRQAEVWSCSPWWWMPQLIFSAPCSGASPECWCWRRVGSCRGRARSQCLGVHCMVKPSWWKGSEWRITSGLFKQQIHLYLAKINPESVMAFYQNGRSKTSGSLLNWGKEPDLIALIQKGIDCVWLRSCLWCCLRYPSLLLFWDCAG